MRIAFADPPYLGLCKAYGHHHGDDGRCWDDPETHRALIDRLTADFDGWALALHSPSLATLLPMCPAGTRVAPWVKSFFSYKPGVSPAYGWEPVLFRPVKGRRRRGKTAVDWHLGRITQGRQFFGAKPEDYVFWVLDLIGAEPDDEFVDMFVGSGAVTRAWERYRIQRPLPLADRKRDIRGRNVSMGLEA